MEIEKKVITITAIVCSLLVCGILGAGIFNYYAIDRSLCDVCIINSYDK